MMDNIIRKFLKFQTTVDIPEEGYYFFYKTFFYKDNSWNKTLIKEFYLGLNDESKEQFINVFTKIFKQNKTNSKFITIVNNIRNEGRSPINKDEFLEVIEALKKLKSENKISISFKALSESLIHGFNSPYSKAYIEDLLRDKPIKSQSK